MDNKDKDKVAVIWGATGQDASYLAELLLNKKYKEVVGVKRRSSTNTTWRLSDVINNENFTLIEGDITDPSSVNTIIRDYQPNEIYNTAAMSYVGTSFEQPAYTFQVNTIGVLNILEAIRHISPNSKLLQCSTSEMFGDNYTQYIIDDKYQDEKTSFSPNSPYAVSKVAAHQLVDLYRRAYNIHANCSICFNHTGPKRGEEFVERKITKWVAQFVTSITFLNQGLPISKEKLHLGNLDAKRDFGHVKDYVNAFYLMLQQDEPSDYVIATGKTHSIQEILDIAFNCIGIDNWKKYVVIDPKFYRPIDVSYLLGSADKIKEKLGWEPKVQFKELIEEMVQNDIELYQKREK